MKKSILILGAISLLTLSMNSCGSSDVSKGKSLVAELETCLGSIDSKEKLNQLSKEEAVLIAKCMLPYLEKMEEMEKTISEDDKQAIEDEVKNSKYADVFKMLNPEAVKNLAKDN
jgi:hypothetical protein